MIKGFMSLTCIDIFHSRSSDSGVDGTFFFRSRAMDWFISRIACIGSPDDQLLMKMDLGFHRSGYTEDYISMQEEKSYTSTAIRMRPPGH